MSTKITRTLGTAAAFGGLFAAALMATAGAGRAEERDEEGEAAKVRQGFAIAPVPLNLAHKNRALVGYGSYLVNAVNECNGCHTSNPQTEFASGGNPYLAQHPKKLNPAQYLSGGRDFGPFPAPGFADIVSRNLTPDKEGKPAGMTFDEFRQVMRTGVDPDKWHPTCQGAPNGHCVPAPIDGSLLQIMPWTAYQDMVDRDILAIYTYLSAIPCIEGDPGNPAGADTQGKRCK